MVPAPLRLASPLMAVTGSAAAVAAAVTAATYGGLLSASVSVGLLATSLLAGVAAAAGAGRTAARRAQACEQLQALGGDGSWDYDLRRGSILYDDRCATMLGYARGQIEDHLSAWGKLVHPDDLGAARRALDEYLEGRRDTYEAVVRMRDAQGAWRRVIDRGQVVERSKDGKPSRIVGIHRLAPDLSRTPSVPARRPRGRAAFDAALRLATRELVAKLQRSLATSDSPGSAAALCTRLERLVTWTEPTPELVPLALLVEEFTAARVTIGRDLPVLHTDPVLLLEVLGLVMDELGRSDGNIEILSAPGRRGSALAFRITEGMLDPSAARLQAVHALLGRLGGSLTVLGRTIELDLPD